MCEIYLPISFRQRRNLTEAFRNPAVILRMVGEGAFLTVLHALLCPAEVPAAPASQRVQRTVAEQTVESVGIHSPVAGKIFAFPVFKKPEMLTVILHDPVTPII